MAYAFSPQQISSPKAVLSAPLSAVRNVLAGIAWGFRAHEIYFQLSSMSDNELRKAWLSRQELAQETLKRANA